MFCCECFGDCFGDCCMNTLIYCLWIDSNTQDEHDPTEAFIVAEDNAKAIMK